MRAMTLEKILADLPINDGEETRLISRSCVTIWLSPEEKASYDRLQRKTGRRFSKSAKAALVALIELAEAKAS